MYERGKRILNTDVMFSSKKEDWETPQDLFNEFNKEFGFDVDVCANEINHKCEVYFDKAKDGLKQDWRKYGTCWMNPPYGRNITGKWIEKAYKESLNGVITVCLLPARTDTKWFHKYIYGKTEIRFLKGRLKFVGAKHKAPFPSMIVIFKGE